MKTLLKTSAGVIAVSAVLAGPSFALESKADLLEEVNTILASIPEYELKKADVDVQERDDFSIAAIDGVHQE